jgi:hypothetical protein
MGPPVWRADTWLGQPPRGEARSLGKGCRWGGRGAAGAAPEGKVWPTVKGGRWGKGCGVGALQGQPPLGED